MTYAATIHHGPAIPPLSATRPAIASTTKLSASSPNPSAIFVGVDGSRFRRDNIAHSVAKIGAKTSTANGCTD